MKEFYGLKSAKSLKIHFLLKMAKDPSIHDKNSSSKGKKDGAWSSIANGSPQRYPARCSAALHRNLKVDTFDPWNGIICYPTSRKLIRLITNNAPQCMNEIGSIVRPRLVWCLSRTAGTGNAQRGVPARRS